MEPYSETAQPMDAQLTPLQQGVRRGLEILYNADELANSHRIDALMKRLANTPDGKGDSSAHRK
jgi:hypothetical protein